MHITLSIDDKTVTEARKLAQAMGKSLNQLIKDGLQRLTQQPLRARDLEELKSLSGQGHSHGWQFDRDELHERTWFS